jgi:hypothetical protein
MTTQIITVSNREVPKNFKIFESIRNSKFLLPHNLSLLKNYDFYIHKKYNESDEYILRFFGYLQFFMDNENFKFENAEKKNKVNLHEFLLIYFNNPFKFVNISEETHESIYGTFFKRVPYYIYIRVLYFVLRSKYSLPVWIEDDLKLIDLFNTKTYIYISNLHSNNISTENLTKTKQAINKGFSDLVRLANYSLSIACITLAQSDSFPPILDVASPYDSLTPLELKKKIIYACFKTQDLDLFLSKGMLDGVSLIILLANALYDKNSLSKKLLSDEQTKQFNGYLDQIFNCSVLNFTSSFRQTREKKECFNDFEKVKDKIKAKQMYFENLNFIEPISNRTYKKLIEFLNQIVTDVLTNNFLDLTMKFQHKAHDDSENIN